ncbi:MAG: serine hydrolase [Brucellaceae bacterium]|nr:serine hydrolase [Brucellaceae bacterium]
MGFAAKILKWMIILVIAAVVGVAAWMFIAPPALILVGTGYASKIVCSNVFVAGRDADDVLVNDVQAPGHPILRLVDIDVDSDAGTVSAALFGIFGSAQSVYRKGLGCAAAPDGDIAAAKAYSLEVDRPAPLGALWPLGDRVEPSQAPTIEAILDDPQMTGPGMRAVVVVHNGRIIGERYGDGFTSETPLIGWSMTKTVNAAIAGTIINAGNLDVADRSLLEIWSSDDRDEIALADLMAMSSGLEFNEDYGDVTDVTRMLYLEPDMASFASDKPLVAAVGEHFNYSSGTAVMLSRIWQNTFDDPQAALRWPHEALFGRLGMTSAVLETDARGTYAGSSYLYANAHDWARFGQFLLQNGVWNGQLVLPPGFVEWMHEEAPASEGGYGRGQVWLHGPRGNTPEDQHSDTGFTLPDDAYWMLGHDGQTTTIIPSEGLVVVRLGLTPSKLGYKPQAMVQALVAALK